MRIQVASSWRNSAHNVVKYMSRVAKLRIILDCDVSIIAGEGDSLDATRSVLQQEAQSRDLAIRIPDCSHGKKIFGSTEEPERMRALSFVFNKVLDNVSFDTDLFLYVESDLMWEPKDIAKLIRTESEFDVVAPLCMAGDAFYDIWGFRKDENRFSPFHPFHPCLEWEPGAIAEVDSIGSCFVSSGQVARAARIRHEGAIVDWCADVRKRGYHIGVRTDIRVYQA